jgi:hypothetical protein
MPPVRAASRISSSACSEGSKVAGFARVRVSASGEKVLSRDTKLDREIPTPGLIASRHWYSMGRLLSW